jgi:hypothetical protein
MSSMAKKEISKSLFLVALASCLIAGVIIGELGRFGFSSVAEMYSRRQMHRSIVTISGRQLSNFLDGIPARKPLQPPALKRPTCPSNGSLRSRIAAFFRLRTVHASTPCPGGYWGWCGGSYWNEGKQDCTGPMCTGQYDYSQWDGGNPSRINWGQRIIASSSCSAGEGYPDAQCPCDYPVCNLCWANPWLPGCQE